MMLRTKGKLVSWKGDRGFGFIRPEEGGADVFVHRRDFGDIPRDPRVGDVVFYQAVRDQSGKFRAGDVEIDGAPRVVAQPFKLRSSKSAIPYRRRMARSFVVGVLGCVLVGTLYFNRMQIVRTPKVKETSPVAVASLATFACEGKQHCSEMKSCEEATFYIRNCPNTKMDGDGDGVPCENQWCN